MTLLRPLARWSLSVCLLSAPAFADHVSAPVAPITAVSSTWATGNHLDSAAAAVPEGYFVVWTDTRAGEGVPAVLATRVAGDGTVLDPSGVPVVTGIGGHRAAGVACTGPTCAVVWIDATQSVWVRRFAVDGGALDPTGHALVSGAVVYDAIAASDGRGFLLGWIDNAIELVPMDGSGVLGPMVSIDASGPFATSLSAAFNGSDWLVSWTATSSDGGAGSALWISFGDAGVFADAGSFTAPTLINAPAGLDRVVSASDGNGWLLAWDVLGAESIGDVYGTRLAPSGALIDAPPLLLSLGDGESIAPQVSFDGTDYQILIHRAFTDLPDLALAAVSPSASYASDAGPFPNAPLVPDHDDRLEPTLVTSLDGGGFVAWSLDRGYQTPPAALLGSILAPGGLQATRGAPLSLTGDAHDNPSVAFDGQHFLIAWEEEINNALTIGSTLLAASGERIGSVTTLSLPAEQPSLPAVSFDGESYLVSWVDAAGLAVRFARVEGDGAETGYGQLADNASFATRPDIALGASASLVVWSHYASGSGQLAYAERVAVGGGPIDSAPIALSDGGQDVDTAVSYGDGIFLAAWQDASSGVIRVGRVRPDGSLLDGAGFAVSEVGESAAPAVAFDGTWFWVAWRFQDSQLDAKRVAKDGTVADASPLVLVSRTDDPYVDSNTRPVLAFDQTSLVVAWQDFNPDSGTDLWGRRWGTASGPLVALEQTPLEEEHPALASATPGRTLLAYHQFEPLPDAGSMRLRTQIWASVPQGYPCLSAAECGVGSCLNAVCCSPSGDCSRIPRAMGVSCGCGSDGSGPTLWAWFAVSLAWAGRVRARAGWRRAAPARAARRGWDVRWHPGCRSATTPSGWASSRPPPWRR